MKVTSHKTVHKTPQHKPVTEAHPHISGKPGARSNCRRVSACKPPLLSVARVEQELQTPCLSRLLRPRWCILRAPCRLPLGPDLD